MNTIKKLTAVALAAVLMLAMSVSAFATNINISSAVEGATYKAYRLLDTTTSLKSEGCHDSVEKHLSSCYNIAYSVNDKYASILQTETGASTDEAIVAYIRTLTTAESIREFADDIFAAIGVAGLAYDETATGTAGKTAILEDVAQGYWLIVEEITDASYDGAYSLVVLDTAGSRDITVATKRDEPALTKYVRDNGMSYGQGADMQIGDDAEFLLITDVPDPIGYATYTYLIHDQAAAGLDINADSVKIQLNSVTGAELSNTYYEVNPDDHGCTDAECDLHIRVKIKEATAAGVLKGDDRLYVTYTAKLNEKANILVTGQNLENANPNTAWLEYSNDPYHEEKTETSQEVTVYVWTVPLTLNKVDADGAALEGAKFVLSLNSALTEADLADADSDGKFDGADKLMPLIAISADTFRVAPAGYAGEVVYEIPAGTAKLQGFDDQVEYYLYETVAPAGYNKLSSPVSFKFFAKYVSSESPLMEAGYPKVAINAGTETSELKADVVNNTGVELPSTGGAGTTMFYILGAVMVLGAVVLLVVKKRMSAEK